MLVISKVVKKLIIMISSLNVVSKCSNDIGDISDVDDK